MNNWNDKNKPVRYWSRDEIEETVKSLGIDRSRFYEYSKTDYKERFVMEEIIRRYFKTWLDADVEPIKGLRGK